MVDLVLDSSIRNWVLIPIFLIMIFMGIARQNVTALMRSATKTDFAVLKHKNTLMRSARLRGNGMFLPPDAFAKRKHFFVAKGGRLAGKNATDSGAVNPMMQSNMMMNMMKGNMAVQIPNMVMMGWLNYFFSGFVLVKLPFPLSSRFKVMMQRGIDLSTLDTSYVSSFSFYFLLMFGLRGLYSLILGQNNDADSAKHMQMQMNMGMGGAGGVQQFDAKAAYRTERDSLRLQQHRYAVPDAESRLLRSQGM